MSAPDSATLQAISRTWADEEAEREALLVRLVDLLGRPLAAAHVRAAGREAVSSKLTRTEALRARVEAVAAGVALPDPRVEEAVSQYRARRPFVGALASVTPPEGALVVVYDPESGQRGTIKPPPPWKGEPPAPFVPTYLVEWEPSLSDGQRAIRVLDRLLFALDPDGFGSASARAAALSYNGNLYREIVRGKRPVSVDRVEEAVESWNSNRPEGLPAFKWRDGVPVPE